MNFSSIGMVFLCAIFILGLFLTVKGGDAFVDTASDIAVHWGMPTFLIGATIVSLATTLPELLVSVFSAHSGDIDLAVGNALGSTTANTGLILGLCVLVAPTKAPHGEFLHKGVLFLLSALVMYFATRGENLAPFSTFLFVLIFIVFIIENIHSAKAHSKSSDKKWSKPDISNQTENLNVAINKNQTDGKKTNKGKSEIKNLSEANISNRTETDGKFSMQILIFVLSALAIAFGAQLLVESAKEIALRFSVPQSVIAVTIIAIGTALPELVTAFSALLKKQANLCIGNILGANIIDTTLILPLCSLVSGKRLPLNAQNIIFDAPVYLLCTLIAIVPTIFSQKFNRIQGLAITAIYLLYLLTVSTNFI